MAVRLRRLQGVRVGAQLLGFCKNPTGERGQVLNGVGAVETLKKDQVPEIF